MKLYIETTPKRDIIAAKAWGELSTRTILKRTDFRKYLRLREDYYEIVREFQRIKYRKTLDEPTIRVLLNRLRQSPFFDDASSPEFSTLWTIVKQKGVITPCTTLFEHYPDLQTGIVTAFPQCNCSTSSVTLKQAMDALERKLYRGRVM